MSEFKLYRRVDTYGANDLGAWLKANPGQAVTIEHDPKGWSHWSDDTRVWRATLREQIGSKKGYLTKTLPELICAVVTDAD